MFAALYDEFGKQQLVAPANSVFLLLPAFHPSPNGLTLQSSSNCSNRPGNGGIYDKNFVVDGHLLHIAKLFWLDLSTRVSNSLRFRLLS